MILDLNLMEKLLLAEILDLACDHLPLGDIDENAEGLVLRIISKLHGDSDDN